MDRGSEVGRRVIDSAKGRVPSEVSNSTVHIMSLTCQTKIVTELALYVDKMIIRQQIEKLGKDQELNETHVLDNRVEHSPQFGIGIYEAVRNSWEQPCITTFLQAFVMSNYIQMWLCAACS